MTAEHTGYEQAVTAPGRRRHVVGQDTTAGDPVGEGSDGTPGYVRNTIWLLTVAGMVAGLLIVQTLHWIESAINRETSFLPEGVRAMLRALAV